MALNYQIKSKIFKRNALKTSVSDYKLKCMKKRIIVLLGLILTMNAFSQEQPVDKKFGKISLYEMNMKQCSIDSSAEAVFLFDIGETKFEYNTSKNRFQLIITKHSRIKILHKDGLG